MGKGKKKERPAVKANNAYIPRDEHRLCATTGCRNAVAVWAKSMHCTLCRSKRP